MVGKVTVTEGEFAGWQTYDLHGTFDVTVGPFYFKPDPDGRMRCAFRAEPKHMNAGDRMHGGCLMTFADIALFQTAYQEMRGGLADLCAGPDHDRPAHADDLLRRDPEIHRTGLIKPPPPPRGGPGRRPASGPDGSAPPAAGI